MATRTAAKSLSDQQMSKLLALIEDSDSVELKVTVPLADPEPRCSRARCRSPRRPDQAGLLLRHA